MTIIQFLVRLIWGKPQTNSLLLELPVEILVKILDLLPHHSQLLVHQTCRSLRAITHEYFLAAKGDIRELARATREEKLPYLTALARYLPDRWVCVKCCKLHHINGWDTPLHDRSRDLLCQDGMDTAVGYRVCRVGWPKYYPDHRHVELTLKYTRMEDIKWRHQKYLQRLLTPHHGQIKGFFDVDKGISGQISVYPKVVNGRYLLLSILTYVEGQIKVSRQSIRFLEICSHISFYETCNIFYGMKKNIDDAWEIALSAENTQKFFSCGLCGTDYSIQASPERYIICIWQDFGPEGTIYDSDWTAMVCENGLVYHKSGSIRKLYGPQEHNGKTY